MRVDIENRLAVARDASNTSSMGAQVLSMRRVSRHAEGRKSRQLTTLMCPGRALVIDTQRARETPAQARGNADSA